MWDWMSDGTEATEASDMECSFKAVLLSGYDYLCQLLPTEGGKAYKEVVSKGTGIGLAHDEAEAFAALYFTLNHERSPLADTLENGAEFVPLALLLDDAVTWFSTHRCEQAAVSLKKYAATSLTDNPVQAGGKKTIELTQLISSDKVVLPVSRAFQRQPTIASQGKLGLDLEVDDKDTLITAFITDKDGQTIDITPHQQQIQATIGQMIMENGAPITVTPAQIYRAYAGMPSDCKVHEEQEAFIVANLDHLMKTDARLDFTRQIAAHKGIKKDPDYDYRNTTLSGALVIGMKIEDGRVSFKGAKRDIAYIIYEAPMYFAYSKAINQIARVDRAMLTGGAAAQKLHAGHPDKKTLQRRPMAVTLRRYLMQQIVRMETGKSKQAAAAIKQKKKPTSTHSENLTIVTIAKSCGIKLTEKLRRNLIANATSILNDFKAGGYIKDFTDYKEGRAVKGFTIKV